MCYARRQRSSWARIKLSNVLYIKCYFRNIYYPYSSFILAFLLLFEYITLSTRLSFFRTCNALHLSLVVQFSMTNSAARSCGQLDYYITCLLPCQYLFSTFFEKIFYTVFGCDILSFLGRVLVFYHISKIKSILFWIFYFIFSYLQLVLLP